MKTKNKIFIAKVISKLLRIFIKKPIKVKRNSINWFLDLNEGIDLSIFLFGSSESNVFKLKKILNKDDKLTFIDIGANIGSVSLPLAKEFKNSKIFSIEPTNYAFYKLEKNVLLNKELKKRIIINQNFITNKKKPSKVWSSWNLEDKENKHKVHQGSLKLIKKNSYISLEKFIILKNISKIDFIKLDVDGFELEVLKSGESLLRKHKPIIFFELAPYLYQEFNYSSEELINFFRKFDYAFYDDNLRQIENIYEDIKKIKDGSSKNFFII